MGLGKRILQVIMQIRKAWDEELAGSLHYLRITRHSYLCTSPDLLDLSPSNDNRLISAYPADGDVHDAHIPKDQGLCLGGQHADGKQKKQRNA